MRAIKKKSVTNTMGTDKGAKRVYLLPPKRKSFKEKYAVRCNDFHFWFKAAE